MDDNTINFFFPRHEGAARPTRDSLALDTSGLNFHTDDPSILNDDEDSKEVTLSDTHQSAITVAGTSADASFLVEPEDVEPSEHDRFARSIQEYFEEQQQPSGPEGQALRHLLVKLHSHAHVSSELELRNRREEEARFQRKERDVWLLLEMCHTRLELPPSTFKDTALTDRQYLDEAFAKSKTVQMLHMLVTWMHLNHADRANARFAYLRHSAATGSVDPLENRDRAQVVWDLIRAGALHCTRGSVSEEKMREMLRSMFTRDGEHYGEHAWRFASFIGGQPYDVSETRTRTGNPHRAAWKLSCRALADSTIPDEKMDHQSVLMERAIYYAVSGGIIPTDVQKQLKLDKETTVWNALRGLEEFWSDCILAEFHASVGVSKMDGVTKREIDLEADEKVLQQAFMNVVRPEEIFDELKLRDAVLKVLRLSAGLPAPLADGTLPVQGADDLVFFRIIHSVLTGKMDAQVKVEMNARAMGRTTTEGSRLRFLANLAFYANTCDSDPEMLLGARITCSEGTMRTCVQMYIESLFRTAEDAVSIRSSSQSNGSSFPSLILDMIPYTVVLDVQSRNNWLMKCLLATTFTAPDQTRTTIVQTILQSYPATALISTIRAMSVPNERNTFWDKYGSKLKEHTEVAGRRRTHVPSPVCEKDHWRKLNSRDLEVFRWSLLVAQLASQSESESFEDASVSLMLEVGNALVREAVQSYLSISAETKSPSKSKMKSLDEETKVLDWKKGEVVLGMMDSFFEARGLMMNSNEGVEFKAWLSMFSAWKHVAVSEAILAEVKASADVYEKQIAMAARDLRRKHLLVSEREDFVREATSEEVLLEGHALEDVDVQQHNLPRLAEELRVALGSALEAPFPTTEHPDRLRLRNEYVGRLVKETFVRLDEIVSQAERMLKQTNRPGLLETYQRCIDLSNVLTREMNNRIRTEGTGEDVKMVNEFRGQIQSCLEVLERFWLMLL